MGRRSRTVRLATIAFRDVGWELESHLVYEVVLCKLLDELSQTL